MLWLPRFWWHYVRQLAPPAEEPSDKSSEKPAETFAGEFAENLSLNFWVGEKGIKEFIRESRAADLPPAAEVQAAAEAAAERAAAAAGGCIGGGDDDGRAAVADADDVTIARAGELGATRLMHAARSP